MKLDQAIINFTWGDLEMLLVVIQFGVTGLKRPGSRTSWTCLQNWGEGVVGLNVSGAPLDIGPIVVLLTSFSCMESTFLVLWKVLYFCLGFLSQKFTIHRIAGEGGVYLFNSSLSLPHASQTLRR